jgi:hypothetical protein
MDQFLANLKTTLSPAYQFWGNFVDFIPKLLLAVVILVLGWLLAKAVAFAVVKSLKFIPFISTVTEKAGIDGFLRQGGIKKSTIDILGILIYWLVILVTLLVAFNTLGLTVVSELFGEMTRFIPKVIAAVIILAIGLYFARFVEDALVAYGKNVGMEDITMIARLARYAIMVFVFIAALGQVKVGGALITNTFLILFGGVVLALALAFGLGSGQKWVGNQIDNMAKNEKKRVKAK